MGVAGSLEENVAEKSPENCYSMDMNDAIRHGMCVSILASELAKELGMSDEFVHKVAVAGMLHDVGKLQISPYIYGRKRNTMKIEEMQYVRLHAKMGADILSREGYDKDIVDMVHYHHENYDGTGYPQGLKGEAIPWMSRILRTCDVFCALTSDRSYRRAFDSQSAIQIMIDEVADYDMRVFLAFQRFLHSEEYKNQDQLRTVITPLQKQHLGLFIEEAESID